MIAFPGKSGIQDVIAERQTDVPVDRHAENREG
jgi:hypothetical protein